MFKRNAFFALTVLFAAWTFDMPAAIAGDWQFDADASAGVSYDSNVGIEDLDANSGEADSLVELAAGGTVTFTPADQPISLRFGYDYSGTSYSRFEMFDLDLHHGLVAVEYRNTEFDAALTFDHYVGALNAANYVDITQVSPSIARLFGNRAYVRAAWIASTRNYDALAERDAKTSSGRVDTYLLLDNLDRYVSLGLQINDETTNAAEFNYESYQASIAYAHTFDLPRMRLKLRGSLRYENRDYAAAETPFAGEPRKDQRWGATLEAEAHFSEHVWLHAMLEQTDNESSLETANLDKFLAGLELRFSF